MVDEPCPCGRTYPRFPDGIYGRLDDKLLIRGLSVYPTAVERALRATPGVGLEFRLYVRKKGHFDSIDVEAECEDRSSAFDEAGEGTARIAKEAERMIRNYTGVGCPVRIVAPETFERMELKARRTVDMRSENTS